MSAGEMQVEKPPIEPSVLFRSSIGDFWSKIIQYYPSQDESSKEIWTSIKWTLAMTIQTSSSFYDSVNIVGKYTYDESWTEPFATIKNVETWKKNVIDHIQQSSSKYYTVKIDVGGTKKLPSKGEGVITVQIAWSPQAVKIETKA
jgi:hypothetical protein